MNLDSLIRIVRSTFVFRKRPLFSTEILSELLDKEIDRDELRRILGMDILDDEQLRVFLSRKHYAQYKHLAVVTEKRKALRVILTSQKLENQIKILFIKAFLYPTFLFNLSFMISIFVDTVLFRTFETMLNFMGPDLGFEVSQTIMKGLIILDALLIGLILLLIILKNRYPLKLYKTIQQKWSDNPWSQMISHQFVTKFLSFYRLGGNFEEIFRQIQGSSELVLSKGCIQSLDALKVGESLSEAVASIDPRLQMYFKMNDEGMDIEAQLVNYNQIQELLITNRIRQSGKMLLAYAYLKITIIIVIIYQMMLKPIEMMGNTL